VNELEETTMHDDQLELLRRARTIAVVGFSSNPAKPSHSAPMELVRRGWTVYPVNPNETEIAGLRAYASLADVPEPVDLVDVFRPAAEAPEVARQAVAAGAGALWLQLGIVSDEARAIAADAGIDYVEDACAGALARRADIRPSGSGPAGRRNS
jgi:predicted CoA-binding protein